MNMYVHDDLFSGNLFGRESPKKPNTNGTADVKKYNLLELSPENEHPPTLETPQLRKSLSLDSRNSYKVTCYKY